MSDDLHTLQKAERRRVFFMVLGVVLFFVGCMTAFLVPTVFIYDRNIFPIWAFIAAGSLGVIVGTIGFVLIRRHRAGTKRDALDLLNGGKDMAQFRRSLSPVFCLVFVLIGSKQAVEFLFFDERFPASYDANQLWRIALIIAISLLALSEQRLPPRVKTEFIRAGTYRDLDHNDWGMAVGACLLSGLALLSPFHPHAILPLLPLALLLPVFTARLRLRHHVSRHIREVSQTQPQHA